MSAVVRPWDWREPVLFFTSGESLTHQSFKSESDINRIIQRYQESGIPITPETRPRVYADVTGLQVDLTQAIIDADDTLAAVDADHVAARRDFEKRKADKAAKAAADAKAASAPPPVATPPANANP